VTACVAYSPAITSERRENGREARSTPQESSSNVQYTRERVCTSFAGRRYTRNDERQRRSVDLRGWFDEVKRADAVLSLRNNDRERLEFAM